MKSKETFYVFIFVLLFITVLTSCSSNQTIRAKSVSSGIIIPAFLPADVKDIYAVGDTVWIHKASYGNEVVAVSWEKTYSAAYFELVVIKSKID